jgi:hypothetical protein
MIQTSSSTAITQPPTTRSEPPSGGNGLGLSGGAIAGIVIGIVAALSAIGCGMFAVFVMGKRRAGKNRGVAEAETGAKPEQSDGTTPDDTAGDCEAGTGAEAGPEVRTAMDEMVGHMPHRHELSAEQEPKSVSGMSEMFSPIR